MNRRYECSEENTLTIVSTEPSQWSAVRLAQRDRTGGEIAPVVWLTGLSGSGKTTLCHELFRRLYCAGIPSEILDADILRGCLWPELGYSRDERCDNIYRVSHLADLVARQGTIALVAAISPYRDVRSKIRLRHPLFLEVYVKRPALVIEIKLLSQKTPRLRSVRLSLLRFVYFIAKCLYVAGSPALNVQDPFKRRSLAQPSVPVNRAHTLPQFERIYRSDA
jgi:hypothetical protein